MWELLEVNPVINNPVTDGLPQKRRSSMRDTKTKFKKIDPKTLPAEVRNKKFRIPKATEPSSLEDRSLNLTSDLELGLTISKPSLFTSTPYQISSENKLGLEKERT